MINSEKLLECINGFTSKSWRLRLTDFYQDIFFISNLEGISKYVKIVEGRNLKNLGIYIQPINQGTSYHCEFDIYYGNNNKIDIDDINKELNDISIELMDKGAFFNRPYGYWAKEVFKRHGEQTIIALKKVKQIFDPNNVLNPGVLCFEE